MRTRLQLTGMSLLIGAAMLLNTGSAFAANAIANLTLDVTFNGLMQDSAVDLAASFSVGGTVATVTDSRPFKPGQYLELNDGTVNWEVLRVVSKIGDGPGGFLTDTLTVERALKGTAQSNYASGTAVYAEFNRIGVNVAGIAPIDTGAQLAAPLDTGLFDLSGALLVEAVNSSATQLKVSDARQTPNAIAGVGGQVKIDSEIMNVVSTTFGVNLNSGAVLEETVLFNSKTVLKINNKNLLQPGWRARVEVDFGEPEEMLILAVDGDGPGGIQDTMTVVRGNISDLLIGAIIYAGQDKITVTRSASPAAHAAAAPISTNFRIAQVNDHNLVTSGSHVAIDTEAMVVLQTPSKHFHTSGATLFAPAAAPDTLLRVTSAPAIATGDIISIDSEQMAVQRSTPGCTVGGGAVTIGAMDIAQTVVGVNDRTLLSLACTIMIGTEEMLVMALTPPVTPCTVGGGAATIAAMDTVQTAVDINDALLLDVGCSIKIQSEEMLVTNLTGDGPGGGVDTLTVQRGINGTPAAAHPAGAIAAGTAIDTMTVQRAYNDTTAATHPASSPIATSQASARVTRGLYATAAAAHASAAVINELTTETNMIRLGRPNCTVTAGAATLAAMDTTQTTVNINDKNLLIAGCSAKVDSEEMMVIGLTGDGANPPGTLTDTMTVQRAYYGTAAAAHAAAAIVQDTVASHLSAAPITDIDGLGAYTVGTASSALTTTSTIAALVSANTAETTISVTNAAALPSSPACSINGTGVTTLAAMDSVQTTVDINDRNLLAVACTVRVQVEDMLLTGVSGDGPGGATDTITVQRGYNGTAAAAHVVGKVIPGTPPGWVIIVDSEKMRIQSVNVGAGTATVVRAVNGTSVASHAISTAIRGPVMLEYSYGSNATLLGSTGRPVDCSLQPTTLQLEGATAGCASQLSALGAMGSGTLSYVELWGAQLLPSTPIQPVSITPTLLDVTADTIPAVGSGTQIIKVLKCGDVNGNGIFNASDSTLSLRAYFGLDPVNLGTMDINLDGALTVGSDVTLSRRILFFSLPGGSMRCLPNVP